MAAVLVALFTIGVGIGGLALARARDGDSAHILRHAGAALHGCRAANRDGPRRVPVCRNFLHAPDPARLGPRHGLQGASATLLGPDHARAVMEWETSQGTALLRVGAAVALAAGLFLVYSLSGVPRQST